MAEGILGGILGDENEKPEVEATETRASADAFAAAVAARLSAIDPEVARDTSAFLKEQTQLLRVQKEHLKDEHAARLHSLRGQAREVDIRRLGLHLRVGFQLFLAILATVIGIGAVIVLRDAFTERGLVVEAFSVPPDLARDGLTGEVVAMRFVDKLQAMQAETSSERPADSYQYNWGSNVKVEIPETGLSLGEVSKFLRDRFGHANHITGELVRTPAGIAVTARFGNVKPATFAGPTGDFDELARQAAEAIFRSSQPYRYAQYAFEHGRASEAFSVISDLAATGAPNERGWAYIEWGMLDQLANGDLESARKHCSRVLAGAGELTVPAEICLVNVEVWSGHEEKALEYSRPLAVNAQRHAPGVTDEYFENNKIVAAAWLETLTGDAQKSAADWTLSESVPDSNGSVKLAPVLAATAYALNHDSDAARAIVAALEPADDPSFLELDATNAFQALAGYWIAAEMNDWPAALADAQACDAWLRARAPANKLLGRLQSVWIQPLEALAMAKVGDIAGAERLAAATPLDCYLCVRVRGRIAAIKQDWASAEGWFAEATRQAPSLPFAFSEWGDMNLAKGDLAGAAAKFAIANHASPHFAGALRGWGEALARQGQSKAARAKWSEALLYAPNWKQLKDALDALAKQTS